MIQAVQGRAVEVRTELKLNIPAIRRQQADELRVRRGLGASAPIPAARIGPTESVEFALLTLAVPLSP
jgi:hypothetical protein